MIERAVILSDSNIFAVDEAWLKREPSKVPHSSVALTGVLLAHEKEAIEAALAQSHGRVSGPAGAAAKLGVPNSTLDAKIKRLGIDKYRFKPRSAEIASTAVLQVFPDLTGNPENSGLESALTDRFGEDFEWSRSCSSQPRVRK